MANTLGQEIRIFELDEAERMLPLVRSIVKGMTDDHAERQAALEQGHRREAEALTERLVEAAGELTELGVELKGLDPGLVDFPALKDGEIVYLCWRYGEDRIAFWHPLETGFAGRRPVERD
ncbi:MAG TPA: DUF2203 domain-containing protein [Gemmatimonadota bacterium]|nr:DUF2203 domain-containing protein [Gemmatimonadota bacterium]